MYALNVLIVDDVPDIVETMCNLVGLRGHNSIPAHGGEEAVRIAAVERPDVVLIDLGMPDVSGWDVCRTLKVLYPDDLPYIVVVSAYSADAFRRNAMGAEIDAHFLKPLDPKLLTDLLDSLAAALPRRGHGV